MTGSVSHWFRCCQTGRTITATPCDPGSSGTTQYHTPEKLPAASAGGPSTSLRRCRRRRLVIACSD